MNRNRTLAILILGLLALTTMLDMIQNPQDPSPKTTPVLSARTEKHILHGDQKGGGHLHGTGKACKSEFPEDWDAQEVIAHIKEVAANDNLSWKEQGNGYHIAESMVENVRVRVVLNQDLTKIITAYPTNVARNPCPRKAVNDN